MTNRKPYVREIKRTWWQKHPFYRMYMLREATILPLIFFTLCLTIGLASLVNGREAWQSWLNFMSNPLVVLLNLLALAGSLFHAKTFFSMMPQVMPIEINGKKLDKKLIVNAQWGIVAAISFLFLVII